MTDFGDRHSAENEQDASKTAETVNAEAQADRIVEQASVTQGSRTLEPRVLLDAAMDATLDAVDASDVDLAALQAEADAASAKNAELLEAISTLEAAQNAPVEYAFIDLGVEDAETLAASFSDNVSVHYIQADTDGVEQIAAILGNATNIDAVHILSHGRSGTLDLGSTKLTEASMNGKHADEMAVISKALSADADILIYGCDFGANARGASAVQALAEMTGADVAASEDLTGAAALGGDWDLEVQAGEIEAEALTAKSYAFSLAPTNGGAWSINTNGGPGTSSVTATQTVEGIVVNAAFTSPGSTSSIYGLSNNTLNSAIPAAFDNSAAGGNSLSFVYDWDIT
ncbi:MAG: DUF4347 domain-containing protein, partial [Pseudomonadota bacterium]